MLHLDTLSKAFDLRVPKKYTIERIMADEHHVVALSMKSISDRWWLMSIFDLASVEESCSVTVARRSASIWRHIDLAWHSELIPSAFLLDGWIVIDCGNEFVWFDKKGQRSEETTDINPLRSIYLSGSNLLFRRPKDKLSLKPY